MYNKNLEYLLDNNPDNVLSYRGIRIRKFINPVFRNLVQFTSNNKFHIERTCELPKNRPLIFSPTHGFRDDVAMTIKTIGTHAYLLYGSIPDFYYSIDGIALWVNGTIIVDRKNKESRKASKLKMKKAIELGANVIIFPEGVWNKTENLIVQKLYPGIYDVAKETGALVVPVATILESGFCHSIMEPPFDITEYSKKEGLEVLRDKMATAKYELMEKYSYCERKNLEPINEYWPNFIEELVKTANGLYDYEIENSAQYIDKNEITEKEVFLPFQNVEMNIHNSKVLVKAKGIK